MAANPDTRVRYPGGWTVLPSVLAYLLGYALTFLWLGNRFDAVSSQVSNPDVVAVLEVANPAPASWEAAAWFFYNANLVDVMVRSGSQLASVNFLLEAGGLYQLLVVVPPLLLVLAGIAVTYPAPTATNLRFDLFTGRLRYAANGAISCLLGYLPLSFLGMFAVLATGTTLDSLAAVVVAGMLYPIAFGGLGGVVGMSLGPDSTPEQDAAAEWGDTDGRWD